MGTIKSEIKNLFLAEHPEQESILKPFLNGFDINYAEVKSINNTAIFSYMIKVITKFILNNQDFYFIQLLIYTI